jgi:hypothetical protein
MVAIARSIVAPATSLLLKELINIVFLSPCDRSHGHHNRSVAGFRRGAM